MLKPRYYNMKDLLEEHASLCRGMDEMHPKDRTLPGYYEKQRQEHLAEQHRQAAEQAKQQQMLSEENQRQAETPRAEQAHVSRYSSHDRALHSFKVLAGMIEEEIMPRDPGILSSTRSEGAYRRDTQREIPKKF